MKHLSNTVLVFDLDDTLYPEVHYQESGVKYLGQVVSELTGKSVEGPVLKYYVEHREADILAYICEMAGWPASTKESLLWMYRNHTPTISLSVETQQFLQEMRQVCHSMAVVTDGRAVSQLAKIKALGIGWMPTYISELWNSEKPEPKRFKAIEDRWPGMRYVYVGDNPSKDFVAPNSLGWATFGLRGGDSNIHPQELGPNFDDGAYMPHRWIDRLDEIAGWI